MSFTSRLETLDQSASGAGLGEVLVRDECQAQGQGRGRGRFRVRLADQQVLPDVVSELVKTKSKVQLGP